MTGDILQGISKALNSIEKDPDAAHDTCLVQLQYLSACCRGIQSPNDDYQSLNERNTVYDAFASGQLTAMYVHVEGFNQVAHAIRESSNQIARVWGTEEHVAKALSIFLEQGMKSMSPLLSLSFTDLALLVETSYNNAPFSCWLETASLMITVYGGQTMHLERIRDMLCVLTTKTFELIPGSEGKRFNNKGSISMMLILSLLAMEHYPDIVDSYFGLLSRVGIRLNENTSIIFNSRV